MMECRRVSRKSQRDHLHIIEGDRSNTVCSEEINIPVGRICPLVPSENKPQIEVIFIGFIPFISM